MWHHVQVKTLDKCDFRRMQRHFQEKKEKEKERSNEVLSLPSCIQCTAVLAATGSDVLVCYVQICPRYIIFLACVGHEGLLQWS